MVEVVEHLDGIVTGRFQVGGLCLPAVAPVRHCVHCTNGTDRTASC